MYLFIHLFCLFIYLFVYIYIYICIVVYVYYIHYIHYMHSSQGKEKLKPGAVLAPRSLCLLGSQVAVLAPAVPR